MGTDLQDNERVPIFGIMKLHSVQVYEIPLGHEESQEILDWPKHTYEFPHHRISPVGTMM